MTENIKFENSEELTLPEGEIELLLPKGEVEQAQNTESETLALQNEKLAESRRIISEEAEPKQLFETDQATDDDISIKNSLIPQEVAKFQAKQNLKNVRKDLGTTDRIISKIIHSPVLDKLSEKSSSSVARPSGILGGSILAFLGSLSYLIFVKYVGITYNYLFFFGFFIIGFIVGIFIEFILKLSRH